MAINTTYPYEASSPGVARHQCDECGGWERSDKGPIRHGKRCDAQEQAALTPPTNVHELSKFAAAVRRTGLTKGRDEDTLRAVRQGYLGVSAAMNTDD